MTESHNDSPDEAVRPFDADADGTAVAEGGGLLILEEYEHAKARGAKIYAELVGFGASQDTYSVTEPDPSGHSYANAITKALRDGGVDAGRGRACSSRTAWGFQRTTGPNWPACSSVFGDRLCDAAPGADQSPDRQHGRRQRRGCRRRGALAAPQCHPGRDQHAKDRRWSHAECEATECAKQRSMSRSAASTASAGRTRRWCFGKFDAVTASFVALNMQAYREEDELLLVLNPR